MICGCSVILIEPDKLLNGGTAEMKFIPNNQALKYEMNVVWRNNGLGGTQWINGMGE